MQRLKNKIAIVTGASKGIGAGIARRFAQEGAHVAVNYAGDRNGADRVVQAIRDAGGVAEPFQADVSKREDISRLFADVRTRLGKPTIVVNNAGIYRMAPIEGVTQRDLEDQFTTNVFGTVYVMQEAVRAFGDTGGSIINLSSIGSQNTQPHLVAYGATKGAVDSLTLGYSRELGSRGIRVNSVAPGLIITKGLLSSGAGEEVTNTFVALTPLGRAGRPEDVANVAVFLASDDAEFVTGERIMASGGWR